MKIRIGPMPVRSWNRSWEKQHSSDAVRRCWLRRYCEEETTDTTGVLRLGWPIIIMVDRCAQVVNPITTWRFGGENTGRDIDATAVKTRSQVNQRFATHSLK